jgi:dTDP-4-amino-4,6-dideoxygalactose transaminase
MIPFSDPSASYKSHKDEIDQAIRRVLDSGWYVLGQEVESFEQEFAAFHGEDVHAVGVANGTDAIALALRCLGLGDGDEIITVSHTAVATVAGIEQAGCRPVFADIDPITRCLCPQSLQSRMSDRTRAIIPVHIFGQPCEMTSIMEIARSNDLLVVEDCSQAHAAEIEGKKVGTFGDLATFSCYPTKNLGALGDGGIVLCPDSGKAEKLRQLRQYGWDNSRESLHKGVNSRLDELQAAVLRVKLGHLDADTEKRREIAQKYDEALSDLPITLPYRDSGSKHSMHLYVIECENRDGLLQNLREKGIGAGLHYPMPVHKHPAYSGRIRGETELPNTNNFYQQHLTIPIFPELSNDSVLLIIESIQEWFCQRS